MERPWGLHLSPRSSSLVVKPGKAHCRTPNLTHREMIVPFPLSSQDGVKSVITEVIAKLFLYTDDEATDVPAPAG